MTDSGDSDFSPTAFDTTKVYTYHQTLYVNSNSILTNVPPLGGGHNIGIVSAIPQDNNGWLGVYYNISLV
jgi:hypothetical protein